MHAAHLVPELALARVVTGGGPYRPGDELSLAFTSPTVSRVVAHDAELRVKCVPLERALVPETIAVVITHAAAPYASGEVLTLSFVDPRVARVHESPQRQAPSIVAKPSSDPVGLDEPGAPAVERGDLRPFETYGADMASVQRPTTERRSGELSGSRTKSDEPPIARTVAGERPATQTTPKESHDATLPTGERPTAERLHESLSAQTYATEARIDTTNPHSERPLRASGLDVFDSFDLPAPSQIRSGERMTFREDAHFAHDVEARRAFALEASTHDDTGAAGSPSPLMHPPRNGRVTVRLDWSSERLRRFVQVVDKLFTIDRLGWYRHSLAMRLLIPDDIACDDMLASVEAMRHLQALRAAAVESLGKPLLAACMPGFSISSEWLATLESSREARAIAGLREALLPYADDGERPIETPLGEALQTVGTIARRELLPENATSVEAFLPLLIPSTAHDAALGLRLAEYRRLLVELFAQTARASEAVRMHQMAQPNHSLDDRLWQLVGAAAEAFGSFAHA